jgi:hypothetical protein
LASSWYLLPNLKGFVVVALEREAADYVLGRDAVVRLERERCGLGLLGGWGPDGDAPGFLRANGAIPSSPSKLAPSKTPRSARRSARLATWAAWALARHNDPEATPLVATSGLACEARIIAEEHC